MELLLLGLAGMLVLSGPVALILTLVLQNRIHRLAGRTEAILRRIESSGSSSPPAEAQEPRTAVPESRAAESRTASARAPGLAGRSTPEPGAPATEAPATGAPVTGVPVTGAPMTGAPRAGSAPPEPARLRRLGERSRPVTGEAAPVRDLEAVIGGQWLTWIGVLAIFCGTAFFLAIDLHGSFLSGVGQLVVGIAIASVFLVIGSLLARRAQRFLGQALLGSGVALLFLAAYAAEGFHHLVPPTIAYAFLAAASLAGAAVALRESSLTVATLTLIGALLTPLFLGIEPGSSGALFPYLILVNLGTAVVSTRRSWFLLALAAFCGSAGLTAWWWREVYTPDLRSTALLGVGGLWLIYSVHPFFVRSQRRVWGLSRALVVLLNGLGIELFLFLWLAPDFTAFRGVTTAGLALLYVFLAALWSRRMDAALARITQYTGIILAALAVPIQFDLAWVSLAWALLGLALLSIGLTSGSFGHRLLGLLVYVCDVFHVLAFDCTRTLQTADTWTPVLNGGFLVGTAVAGVLCLSAWLIVRHSDALPAWERRLVSPLVITAASLFFCWISIETVAAFATRERMAGQTNASTLANLSLSLVWAAYSALLILTGFLARYRPIRLLGVVIIGILTLKVFLLDTQGLERGYRIASFVGVGALFLVTSILYQRGKTR